MPSSETSGRATTKILVVSDAVREAFYSPEVVVQSAGVSLVLSCGDLPYPYLEYIVTMLNVPLLYVLGNHDRPMETSDGRTVTGPEGGINVDQRVVEMDGLLIGGLEGSMAYGGGPHQYTDRQMRRNARRMLPRLAWNRLTKGRAVDLMISHAAPLGVHDGTDRAHRGFAAFRRLIERHRPRYWIHGHVHPSYGYDVRPAKIGGTTVINVYGACLLEVER